MAEISAEVVGPGSPPVPAISAVPAVPKAPAPAKPAPAKDVVAEPKEAAPKSPAEPAAEEVPAPAPKPVEAPKPAAPAPSVPVSAYFVQGPTGDPAKWVSGGFDILMSITKTNHSGEEIGANLEKFKDALKLAVTYSASMFPMTRRAHDLKNKKGPLEESRIKELLNEMQGWKGEIIGKFK